MKESKTGPRTSERDRIIGNRVRETRQRLGITQETLAKRMGISAQQLQKYEKGLNKISASRIEIAAETLRVPLMAFFDERQASLYLGDESERKSRRKGGGSQDFLLHTYKAIASERLRKLLVYTACVLAEEAVGKKEPE